MTNNPTDAALTCPCNVYCGHPTNVHSLKIETPRGAIVCKLCADTPQPPPVAPDAVREDYEPFGDEWRKEMMQFSKAQMLERARSNIMRLQAELAEAVTSRDDAIDSANAYNIQAGEDRAKATEAASHNHQMSKLLINLLQEQQLGVIQLDAAVRARMAAAILKQSGGDGGSK